MCLPSLKRRWEAKKVATAEEEGVVAQAAMTKEEYDMSFILSNSLIEYHLHVKKPGVDDE